MAFAWSGATQSNGRPATLYEYRRTFSNRTANSIHLKLELRVRMRDRSAYFSFQIAHETKVYGGAIGRNERYQWAWVKQGRGWWGHQGSSGDGWLWTVGSYDYYGDNWHGWYTVFDQDVPLGVDDDMVYIVPCITRPPVLYDKATGNGGGWTPSLDKNNWQGSTGYWRPFGPDEYPWYFYHYDHPCEEDLAFGNNRWLEPLGGGTNVGKYVRPGKATGAKVSPDRIDVSLQDSGTVDISWKAASGAAGYSVVVCKGARDASKAKVVVNNIAATKMSVNPKKAWVGGTNWKSTEIMDGETFYFGIVPHDAAWVTPAAEYADSITWVGPVTYYEAKSASPDSGFLLGKRGERNWVIFTGETCKVYYSGQFDGSYPIAKLVLRRSDGVEVSWKPSEAKSDSLGRYVVRDISGWPKAGDDVVFELRAYNTKNRPVYLASYNGGATEEKWLKIIVRYYGGTLYVWGKSAFNGNETEYARRSGNAGFNEGVCRVWDGEAWLEAETVYVWNGDGPDGSWEHA